MITEQPADPVDYSKIIKIALVGGVIIPVKVGSYREYVPATGKKKVFECLSGESMVIGLEDSIIALWFYQELDN